MTTEYKLVKLDAIASIIADAAAASAAITAQDAIATAADRVQTGLDKTATAADRVQTGLDKTATAADRVQTGLDKTATAADRVQTGLDRAELANVTPASIGAQPAMPDATQAEMEAGTEVALRGMSPQRVAQAAGVPHATRHATGGTDPITPAAIGAPTLAGVSGGQTLIGGTGVADALSLIGTSVSGDLSSKALKLKVGSNGNLEALAIANNGQLTLRGDATINVPTYGSELLADGGWTVPAGWTESPNDTFTHASGVEVAPLTHSATVANATRYQISWVITNRTTGSVTVSVGGQSVATQTASGSFGPTTTATTAFTITPTGDFNGTVSAVSLKAIVAVSPPSRVVLNSAGTVISEERGNTTSTFIGPGSGRYNTTGANNSAQGMYALYSNTTGANNSAQGMYALYSNTTGANNSAQGSNTLRSNTTGNYNSAQGSYALYSNTTGNNNSAQGSNTLSSNTTGSNNSAQGYQALSSNTTGNYNSAQGINAGRFQADGATILTDPENSIYIGANSRGKDNNDSNSVVIGFTAIGLGANTTVLGNSLTTLTRLYGNLGLGVDSPSAAIHAVKTTEQLRLGYDASNYLSATVSSTGNATLNATGNTIFTPNIIENTVSGQGVILKSPDGTRYKLTIANGGTVSVAAA